MTPVEFYTARLDAQEAAVSAGDCRCDGDEWLADCPDFIAADIAAKRAVLALAVEVDNVGEIAYADCNFEEVRGLGGQIVRHLMQPFADHPDYDQAWRLTKVQSNG